MNTSAELPQAAPRARVAWVDSARCLAMFFIMWLHVGQAPGWLGHPVGGGICLFFVLAGYFMPREPERAAKRALYMGLAWVLWTLISFGLYRALAPDRPWSWQQVIGYGVAAYNAPLWFLRNLCIYQLIIAALITVRLLPRCNWLLLAVLAGATYTNNLAQHECLRFDWLAAVLLGYSLKSISLQRIEQWLRDNVWYIICAIAILLLQREFYMQFARAEGLKYYRLSLPLVHVSQALILCLTALGLSRWLPRLNGWMATAGGCMMFTYVTHSLLYAPIYHFDLPRWCGFAYAAAGIALLTLLYRVLSARFPRTMRALTLR